MDFEMCEVTQAGRVELGRVVVAARATCGQTNWEDFADYLSEVSQYEIRKDALWKVAEGNYSRTPSLTIVYALLQLPEFRLADGRPMDLDLIMSILSGKLNAEGSALEASHRNPG